MEIQQHDGVVVDAAGLRQGFASNCGRRKRCSRGGRHQDTRVRLPSPLPSFI